MNKDLRIGRKFLCLIIALVMVMTLIPRLPASFAYAAAGDVPDHDKVLTVNGDGTYTIALNVTGDSEKQIQKVNVIVIVDRSNSMDTQSGTGAYVPSNQNGTNMFGLVDGEYVSLTRTDNGYWANPRYTYSYTIDGVTTQYTGQRYQYDATATRIQATRAAVDSLAGTLLAYNGKDGNPSDTVEMALVTFATASQVPVSSTTDASTYTDAVNAINTPGGNAGGTNWESALKTAATVDFDNDGDPTYVIFFSDGAPTFYGTGPSGTGQEQEPNMRNSYDASTDDAATLAQKVGADNFYTIFAYGSDAGRTYMTDLTAAAGAPAANNYSASNTAELNDAFAAILEAIELAGIGAVSMEDGTTSKVTTTTGEISNLLTVDESSYKYYRAGGDYSDIDDYDPDNGEYGAEWTDAPAASFEDGAVKWNLESEGVLEDEVTYTVTFDCWPSQTTLDIAADIKNDPSSYNELDANIKKYINPDGSLKTNTTASFSYTDTRTGESNSEDYVNPDPVTTSAIEELAVSKEWENNLDGQQAEPITLTVTRDEEPHYTMRLGDPEDPDDPDSPRVWTDDIFISIGILRHSEAGTETDSEGKKFEILEIGHDFTFEEPSDLGYYWELEVPTVRPMLVDGTMTMLILKEAKAPYNNPDNTTEYTINGKTYYTGQTGAASLTAVNHRRARLNITKVVDGEDADPEQTFPFTVTVNDSKASEGSENNLNSDYWVWFSVWNGGPVDCVTSEANKEYDEETGEWTGYYYVKSGTEIQLDMKAGDNLRFLNLPTDSTYTIVEGTLPANYAFTSSELTSGVDDDFSGAQTTTGTIVETETDYTVTYTNTYGKSAIEIIKVWDDADDQDGKRPTTDEFKAWLKLLADGTDVTEANASKLTVTEGEDEDGNTIYTAKWTDLDRYADGEEIEYTVTETPSDDYSADKTEAEDHDTITNRHTPEVIDITVNKEWVGPEAEDGAEVTLKADGKAVPAVEGKLENPVTLSSSNNNTYTWEDLPKFADGKEIKYTVEEAEIENYDTEGPTGTGTSDDPFVFTNTNTETVDVPVTKVWVGPEATATIHLLADEVDTGKSITLPIEGDDGSSINTYTFEDLPKYDSETGEEIEYTVEEDPIDGYTTEGPTGNATDGFTFTNTNDERVTISVEKVWDDDEDRDGIRPDSLTVHLKADGAAVTQEGIEADQNLTADDWAYTWEDLYKYDQESGEEIEYTVTEDAVDNYTPKSGDPAGTGTEDDPFVFTNTYEPGKTSVSVTKVWSDGNDQDGIRPEKVEVTLLANGEAVTQSGITGTVELPVDGKWSYTWTGLNQKEAGEDIVYTVVESETDVITGEDGPGTYAYEVTGDDDEGFTVTNTHTPETTEIKIQKVWEDSDDIGKIRPTSIQAQLTADGKNVGDPVTLQGDSWSYTWTELPKYADGVEIEYAADETAVPSGYTKTGPTGSGTADDPITVTNTYNPKPVSVDPPVQKIFAGPENDTLYNNGAFTFKIEDTSAEGVTAPMPANTSIINSTDYELENKKGYYEFGVIEFTAPGTYEYTVTESGSAPGVTPDPDAATGKTLKFTVTDDGKGNLVVSPTTDQVQLSFTNTYGYESTTATIETDKSLHGKKIESGQFSFVLAGDGDVNQTKTNDADGHVEFDEITYDAPGTFNYTIKEVKGDDEHVTYDGHTINVTVTVTDDKEGHLVAEVSYDDEEGFINDYTPDPTKAVIEVLKELTGRDLNAGEFTFKLHLTGFKAEDDSEADTEDPEETSDQNEEGTPDEESQTDDSSQNESGSEDPQADQPSDDSQDEQSQDEPQAEQSQDEPQAEPNEAAPAENDAAPDEISTESDATTEGMAYMAESEVSFLPVAINTRRPFVVKGVVEQEDQTAKNEKDGTVTFKEIEYDQPGTYTYEITEVKGDLGGVTYSDEKITVKVVVTWDKEAGTYTAEVQYPDDKTFNNTYSADPVSVAFAVEKELNGRTLNKGEFTFELLEGDTSIGTATNDAKGKVEFDSIKYEEPGEHTYTIKEVEGDLGGVTYSTNEVTVSVKVTDNLKGKLEADVKYEGSLTFTNTYEPEPTEADIELTKELNGKDLEEGEFTFELRNEKGTVIATASNDADGNVKFESVPFEEEGEFEYTVKETVGDNDRITYDTKTIKVKISVTDDLEGHLVAEVSYPSGKTFTNEYDASGEITPEVEKVLDGADLKNGQFTFEILDIDDEVIGTATNDADGVVTFDTIEYSLDDIGEKFVYTIREVDEGEEGITYDDHEVLLIVTVEDSEDQTGDLVVTGEYEGDTTFTNLYEEEEEEPPKTGDTTIIVPYILIGVSAIALLLMILFRRRKNNA